MFDRFSLCRTLLLIGMFGTLAAAGQTTLEVPRPPRRGQAQQPAIAHLWIPDDLKQVRGLIVMGKILVEKDLYKNTTFRKAAADNGLAILYFQPHFDALFSYHNNDCEVRLLKALADLAEKSGHPEIQFVPWLTFGHSTGGIFCRNVAYWQPDRVVGVIHFKSGNFQDHIPDPKATLAGVPILVINGEFEEFGPAGGDLKAGLRARYSLHENKKKQNQSQWVLARMQILERRRRNPANLMSLVIDRGRGHTNWSNELEPIVAQFITSACRARIPDQPPAGRPVICKPIDYKAGYLSDADLKNPQHPTASWAEYSGDKQKAFWHLDKAMAQIVDKHHAKPWPVPDPTADMPDAERYTPPAELQDKIDLPSTTRPATEQP